MVVINGDVDLYAHLGMLWRGCYSLKHINTVGGIHSCKTRSNLSQYPPNPQPTEVNLG